MSADCEVYVKTPKGQDALVKQPYDFLCNTGTVKKLLKANDPHHWLEKILSRKKKHEEIGTGLKGGGFPEFLGP